MLHHFPKFFHDTVVALQLFLLSLHLTLWHVHERPTLLIRSDSAQGCRTPSHMCRTSGCRSAKIGRPSTILRAHIFVVHRLETACFALGTSGAEEFGFFNIVQIYLLLFSGLFERFELFFKRTDFCLHLGVVFLLKDKFLDEELTLSLLLLKLGL